MPKKLMMNNYSENGLMPVMDGLVCWLDARDAYRDNRIYDRVGLNDFLLKGSFENNIFYFNNKHLLYSENKFDLSDNFTLNINVRIDEISSYGLLLYDNITTGGDCTFKICNRNNNKIGFYSSIAGTVNEGVVIELNKNLEITMVFTSQKVTIFDNSQKITTNTINQIDLITYIAIASLESKVSFQLNSFKIYNRALTEEEIQQNYLYEQSIERG